MSDKNIKPDYAQISEFFTIMNDTFAAALKGDGYQGYMQLSRVHPVNDKLTVVGRFRVGDTKTMIDAALLEVASGHNVYINMALNAYVMALTRSFTEPPSSRAAKQEWRLEVDQVAQFVEERCRPDHKGEETFSEVFNAYREWAVAEGIHLKMAARGFRDRLKRLGYGDRRDCRSRFVTGLRLYARATHWNDPDDFG